MGFSRRYYFSGLPFLFLGDLANPWIETMSLSSPTLAGKLFTTNATWKVKSSSLSQTTYLPVWFNVGHVFFFLVVVVVFFLLLTCICLNNSVLTYFRSNSSSPNCRGICAKTGFPWWLSSKESACNAGDLGLNPEWENPLEEEMAIHSSILAWEILGAQWATIHGVTKSQT